MARHLEKWFKKAVSSILSFAIRPGQRQQPLTDTIQRILVVRQHNQLGDMLCVVPLLRALRRKFPSAHMTLLASPVNYDVMVHNRNLDEVLQYDKREFLGGGIKPGTLRRFIRNLRDRKFDLAIVPATVSMSFTSDLLCYLSGAKYRIGPRSLDGTMNTSAFLFSHPVDLNWQSEPHRHQTLRNMDVAAGLCPPESDLSLEITLTESEKQEAREFLGRVAAGREIVIGFHPGAGKPPNRWHGGKFAGLANRLCSEFNALALITSGPMDDAATEEMIDGLKVGYEIIRNKPIRHVASVLAGIQLMVTNDTGIMHVAGAVGIPVISLFGPTDPQQWAPIGKQNRYIVGRDGNIDTISVDEVFAAASKVLTSSVRQSV